MASLLRRPDGKRWIQFWDRDKKRQTLRLGKTSQKKAERIKNIVEDLLSSLKLSQMADDKTLQWLDECDDEIYAKLVAVGLVESRNNSRLNLFIDDYIAGRTDLKPRTINKFKATKDYLIEHFDEETDMRKVNEADAKAFRIFLLSQKDSKGKAMAENTVRKHCQITKQFFNFAISTKLLRVNPFASLPSTVMANKERMQYITHDEARAVIDACPDAQWRLIFALARYGALRCPSEILELKWSDVDDDKDEMLVRSGKTAHHVGQGSRRVPLFRELAPFLAEVRELSEGHGEYLIHRYRGIEANLRTELHRIIKKAHLEPWPKAFQNLRASRATDLVMHLPLHVVSQWTGHSIETMRKFYLQVTEEHKRAALKVKPQLPPKVSVKVDILPTADAKPKAKPLMSESMGNDETEDLENAVFSGFDFEWLSVPTPTVAAEGLEPPTRGL